MAKPLTPDELGTICDYFTYEEIGIPCREEPAVAMTERHEAAEQVCKLLHRVNLDNMAYPQCKLLGNLLDAWHLHVETENEATANRDAQETTDGSYECP